MTASVSGGETQQNFLMDMPAAPVARSEPIVAKPVAIPSAASDRFAGSDERDTENVAGPVVPEPEPQKPSYHSEPYQLTNPMDDDEVAEDRGDALVIPPLPKD